MTEESPKAPKALYGDGRAYVTIEEVGRILDDTEAVDREVHLAVISRLEQVAASARTGGGA